MLPDDWTGLGRVLVIGPTAYLALVLLLRDGVFLDRALRTERVMRAEVEAALRAQGKDEAAGIAAVVLETGGTLTVIGDGRAGAGTLDFDRKGDTS